MNKCPKCGKKLLMRIEGSTQIIECSSCSYSVATSYIDPIYEDEQKYTIVLDKYQSSDRKGYSSLAKIIGTNVIGVKRLIENVPVEIFSGKAPEIKTVIDKLKEIEIDYHIEPDFKYL